MRGILLDLVRPLRLSHFRLLSSSFYSFYFFFSRPWDLTAPEWLAGWLAGWLLPRPYLAISFSLFLFLPSLSLFLLTQKRLRGSLRSFVTSFFPGCYCSVFILNIGIDATGQMEEKAIEHNETGHLLFQP